jgi:hypothetical protein
MTTMEGANSIDSAALSRHLDAIDDADDELESLKGSYMLSCKGPRERIKTELATVKESGVNVVAFRAVLAAHRDKRAADKRIAALDLADKADFEAMKEALGEFGDTPLGTAALSRARPAGPNGDMVLDTLA